MYSELVISFPLTKRLKTDNAFKAMLFPSKKQYQKVEEGINIANCLDDNESLFSKQKDSDASSIVEAALRNCSNFKYVNIKQCEKEILEYKKLYRNMGKLVLIHNEKHSEHNRRRLILTPMVIARYPSPIKSIRFIDYVFPLDSEMFLGYNLEPK